MVYIDKRYLIALLSCLGFVFVILLRSLSDMRIEQWFIEHETYDSSTIEISDLIFFIGRMTSLLSGIISNRYGGAVTFGVAMLSCTTINLLLELLLPISLVLFMVVEFFDGVIQGIMNSAVADIWSRWTTLQHRSKYVCLTLTALHLPEIIQKMLFPKENDSLQFVAIGAAIWAIVWLLLVKNDPSQDENLSNTEKIILQERLKFLDEKSVALSQYPWLPILTSKSFWALNGVSFITGVSTLIISGILPGFLQYFAENDNMLILNTSLTIIIIIIVACVVDYIRNNNIVTNNEHLKIFVCVSFVVQGIILIAFHSSYNYPTVMFLLYILCLIFSTSAEVSIRTTVVDLSPKYASLLNGTRGSFYTLGLLCISLLENLITDWLSKHHSLPFVIFYFIGALLYYIFGSTKLQSWNGISNDGQELEEYRYRAIIGE